MPSAISRNMDKERNTPFNRENPTKKGSQNQLVDTIIRVLNQYPATDAEIRKLTAERNVPPKIRNATNAIKLDTLLENVRAYTKLLLNQMKNS